MGGPGRLSHLVPGSAGSSLDRSRGSWPRSIRHETLRRLRFRPTDLYGGLGPPGDYEVSVTLIHRGKYRERFLTDDERFARDDLERYEVLLRRASLSRRS